MKKVMFCVALIFIFSASFVQAEYKGSYGSFTDPRDGYTYKTVKIGTRDCNIRPELKLCIITAPYLHTRYSINSAGHIIIKNAVGKGFPDSRC